MTYQDPDPLRDRDLDRNAQINREYGSNAMWGWIAGAVVVVLMLVFLFGGTNDTNTASNTPSAPIVNTPPANNTANAPRSTLPRGSSSTETTGSSAPNTMPPPASSSAPPQ
jgi:hypothetical protein